MRHNTKLVGFLVKGEHLAHAVRFSVLLTGRISSIIIFRELRCPEVGFEEDPVQLVLRILFRNR